MTNGKMYDKLLRMNPYNPYGKYQIVRMKLLKKFDYKCQMCNGVAAITHHKNGMKKDHRDHNILVLCRKCHYALHAKQGDFVRRHKVYPNGKTLDEMSKETGLSKRQLYYNYYNYGAFEKETSGFGKYASGNEGSGGKYGTQITTAARKLKLSRQRCYVLAKEKRLKKRLLE